MAAPALTVSFTGSKVSRQAGFDSILVSFRSDMPYQAFECRATKAGEPYGVGEGALIASFSSTPAGVEREFAVYDDFLVRGDGQYRISLFAQGEDGSWNDNYGFIPSGSSGLRTADGKKFLCGR